MLLQFFLELWAEINRRATLRSRAEEHPSLPDPTNLDDSSMPEETIFEELVLQYGKLASRAENIMVHQICAEVEGELKKHLNAPPRQYVFSLCTEKGFADIFQ
jgi:RAD50-interacting protein 1